MTQHQVYISVCLCGGRITADTKGIPDAVRRHQRTSIHRRWAARIYREEDTR